jgi:chromosomal replication initiator protein
MAIEEQPIADTWRAVLTSLESDDTITPMLYGFLNLVEPKGIAAGTFYLEVPNEFTASMLNQRMRVPLLTAMSQLSESTAVSTFYVVVNPELEKESIRPVQEKMSTPTWTPRRHRSRSSRAPHPSARTTPG